MLGYIDYPENGESWNNQYRSWLRRDAVMMLKYALAKVACKTQGWSFGNGGPLGLIDMSEENGDIPGTSDRYCNDGTYIYNECETDADCAAGRVCEGSPGHPDSTHEDGHDIDVAYYQVDTANNAARPVCDHYENGQEAYHCTSAPHLLDPWRTALFLGYMFEYPYPDVRVIGVDGQVGPVVVSALATLCETGWLSGDQCDSGALQYETTNGGSGWYHFHHHHAHLSLYPGSGKTTLEPTLCLTLDCDGDVIADYYEGRFSVERPTLRLPNADSVLR